MGRLRGFEGGGDGCGVAMYASTATIALGAEFALCGIDPPHTHCPNDNVVELRIITGIINLVCRNSK